MRRSVRVNLRLAAVAILADAVCRPSAKLVSPRDARRRRRCHCRRPAGGGHAGVRSLRINGPGRRRSPSGADRRVRRLRTAHSRRLRHRRVPLHPVRVRAGAPRGIVDAGAGTTKVHAACEDGPLHDTATVRLSGTQLDFDVVDGRGSWRAKPCSRLVALQHAPTSSRTSSLQLDRACPPRRANRRRAGIKRYRRSTTRTRSSTTSPRRAWSCRAARRTVHRRRGSHPQQLRGHQPERREGCVVRRGVGLSQCHPRN